MHSLKKLLTDDHRHCDTFFTDTEQAVANKAWDRASAAFSQFQQAMLAHFAAEENLLFPAFEAKTGMSMGPTEVMRGEHVQMRKLMDAARDALRARDANDYDGYAETLLIMMQQHNVKEENVLYPMCDQHLSDQCEPLLAQLREKITAAAA